jgi:3-hydroxyisobutyrate dehydrogenase
MEVQPMKASSVVHFIGVGAMGGPMAQRLLEGGHTVRVFDTNAHRIEAFSAQHGEQTALTSDQLGVGADYVVMILPNSIVVEEVLFGKNGLVSRLKKIAMIIDMTSGQPEMTLSMGERLATLDIFLIDAPVSGAVPRAQNGTLTIMTGGEAAVIDRAEPLLSLMGTVTRTGALGSGHAMKALNNLVSCAGYLIGIEALIIGSKFGLDPEVMVDVLNSSTGMNNSTQKKFKQYVLSRKFDSGFPLHMMVKDIAIAMGLARNLGVPAPFGHLCLDLWSGAKGVLGPNVDHTAVARLSEQLAGWQIPESEH